MVFPWEKNIRCFFLVVLLLADTHTHTQKTRIFFLVVVGVVTTIAVLLTYHFSNTFLDGVLFGACVSVWLFGWLVWRSMGVYFSLCLSPDKCFVGLYYYYYY